MRQHRNPNEAISNTVTGIASPLSFDCGLRPPLRMYMARTASPLGNDEWVLFVKP